jgi:uncharacterized protein YndB with AHSA1/START domain
MANSRFVYVTYIRTTSEKLWQALIDPEFTRQYWSETRQESEWKPGASWRIMIPDGRTADSGEILEIEPPRKLVLTWRNEFMPELQAEGHKPESKLIEAVSSGWPQILASLKSLHETGESLAETRNWPKGM